jgi:CheY-like chemotaxis protein
MKILIVEDDEPKAGQLSTFIKHRWPTYEIVIARSIRSGLEVVTTAPPTLVLLDMTIPTYDSYPGEVGGKPQNFGGKEFLAQMDRFDIFIPVIVVTQFESFGQGSEKMDLPELDNELSNEFGNVYRGAIYYHTALESWKQKLADLISSAGRK